MMAAESLYISGCLIMPSDVLFYWSSLCRCACSAGADPVYRAPHVVQAPAASSYVQASCLQRARPMAVAVFAGGLAACSTAPPGRRGPERKRRAKAEGKIKGRGTQPLENLVCTWGGAARAWERRRAARVRKAASALVKACASHARLRWSWKEARHEQARR